MKKKTSVRYIGWISSITLAILMICVVVAPPAKAAEQNKPSADIRMENLQEYFETGLKFHGHKCPAMPLGIRAGLAAMKTLGVERLKDKELLGTIRNRKRPRSRMLS